jgi:hypothetical protein
VRFDGAFRSPFSFSTPLFFLIFTFLRSAIHCILPSLFSIGKTPLAAILVSLGLVAARIGNMERFFAKVERFSHRKQSDEQEHRGAALGLGSRPRLESRMFHRGQMIDSQSPYHSQFSEDTDFFGDDDDVPLDAFGEQQSHPYQSCH